MDYNTLLHAHGIDINDCSQFESISDPSLPQNIYIN